MSERASSGLFPLVLLALILVISAFAVVMGSDDAQSVGGKDRSAPSATAAPTAATAPTVAVTGGAGPG